LRGPGKLQWGKARPVNGEEGGKRRKSTLPPAWLCGILALEGSAGHRTIGPFVLHTSGHPVRPWVFGPGQSEGAEVSYPRLWKSLRPTRIGSRSTGGGDWFGKRGLCRPEYGRDEAVALLTVEPLHSSLCHATFSAPSFARPQLKTPGYFRGRSHERLAAAAGFDGWGIAYPR
jgi:hypothetical protein